MITIKLLSIRTYIYHGLLTIFACIQFVTVVHAEGLEDLYRRALERDPNYLAQYHKRAASDQVLAQARSLWLPQISGSVRGSRISQDIIRSDNTVFASGETMFNKTEYSVNMRQSLLSYSKLMVLEKADISLKRFAAEFNAAEQRLIQQLTERYFAVLAANESLSYILTEKQAVQEQFDLVEAKLDRGLANTVNFQDAQARLLQVSAREIELRNALENSKVDLKAMIGELPASLRLMDNALPLTRPSPSDAEVWIQAAYEQNPVVVAKRFEVEESKKEIEQQRGGYFPTVDLTASYSRDDTGGSLFGGGSEVDTGMIMLELNVPLYSGGATTSRYREAVSINNQTREELRAIMMELERNIVTAMNGINNSIAKVEALDKLVEASQTSVELKRTAYDTGLASTIDVLDAERNLFFARSEYARARYEYVIYTIALKHAAGLLDADDVIDLDRSMLSGTNVLSLH